MALGKVPRTMRLIGRQTLTLQKSIFTTYENCDRQPQSADLWIVSSDRTECYAIAFVKRIRNNLKALAIHFYVRGRCETEILDLCATIGAPLHLCSAVLFGTVCLFCRLGTSLFADSLFNTTDQLFNFAGFL